MEMDTTLDSQSLKVLGADTRQNILKELKERPHTASELSRHLDKHITTIKEHLDLLMEAGLVDRNEREGRKWVYYSLSRKGEKLFKSSYSWVVILGLSLVCILAGILPVFQGSQMYMKELSVGAVRDAAESSAPATAATNLLPVIMIVAGLAGMVYLLYKNRMNFSL